MTRATRFQAIVWSAALIATGCKGKSSHAEDQLPAQSTGDGGLGADAAGGIRSDASLASSHSPDGSTESADGASAASGGRNTSSRADAGDAGQSDCPTQCPAPSVCGRIGTGVFCVCPPGMHFVDVGDDKPPCAEDCSDCDGG